MSEPSDSDSLLLRQGRFVLLWHELPEHFDRRSHYDLMLESGKTLKTWEILEFPRAGVALSSRRLADHRIEYLSYEGPISGGMGTVSQVDSGTFVINSDREPTEIDLIGRKATISLRFSPFLNHPDCEILCLRASDSLGMCDSPPQDGR